MSGKTMPLFRTLAAVSLLGTSFVASSAYAEDNGRYRLEGTETGYVRLDTRTGALSVCNEQQGQLICKMATEDREAYENDIADLQDRVKKLEDKVTALEAGGASATASSCQQMRSLSSLLAIWNVSCAVSWTLRRVSTVNRRSQRVALNSDHLIF